MKNGANFYEILWLFGLYYLIDHQLETWLFWTLFGILVAMCPKWIAFRDWYEVMLVHYGKEKKEERKQIEKDVEEEAENS